MEPIRSFCSASIGLPLLAVGRLLHYTFRGLLSVYSRYGLHARQVAYATLYTRGSDDFVSSVAALIATGWSEPVPGRDFHPLRTSAFHGAPQTGENADFNSYLRVTRYSGGSTELRWQDLTPRSVPETPLELLRQAQAPQHIDKPGVATEISEGRIDLQERDILAVMFCVSLV